MAEWDKHKFYYESRLNDAGAILSATTTDATDNYNVAYLADWLEWTMWKAANVTVPMYITLDSGGNYGAEEIVNGDFETAGGGDPDFWGTVVESAGDGTIANETTNPYAGTNSAKLTEGVSDNTSIKWNLASGITAGDIKELNFYTAGDGTNDGSFSIYDVTNAADIIARTATGEIGAPSGPGVGYSLVTRLFEIPASCTEIDIIFYPKAATSTAIAYFDAVSLKEDTQDKSIEYFLLDGHNLSTIGASVQLEYSYDNFIVDTNAVESAVAPPTDNAYKVNLATAITAKARFTRIKITGTLTAAPFIHLATWGLIETFDWVDTVFDPNGEMEHSNDNFGKTGILLGSHVQFYDREVKLDFQDGDTTLYAKGTALWNHYKTYRNFYWEWNGSDFPDDLFLMRLKGAFKNPFTFTALNRNISVDMIGRVA